MTYVMVIIMCCNGQYWCLFDLCIHMQVSFQQLSTQC